MHLAAARHWKSYAEEAKASHEHAVNANAVPCNDATQGFQGAASPGPGHGVAGQGHAGQRPASDPAAFMTVITWWDAGHGGTRARSTSWTPPTRKVGWQQ